LLEETIAITTLLNDSQKDQARSRLMLAHEYIDDNSRLGQLVKSGRLLIVDLRDELILQDEALGLFVIMLNIFANVRNEDGSVLSKFIVFDEAHKYMSNRQLTQNIVTAIREMRHKGVSLLIASQDPPSLPNEIIELSSILVMHEFRAPQWLKHVQRSLEPTAHLTPKELSSLNAGEAYVWAAKANAKSISQQPMKVTIRPRATKHGGATIKAG
jgi:DNA helicase HerA-like ATPase